jgi:hypothetical protein
MDVWSPNDEGYPFDGVQYDTEHADGHLDQFSTPEEDARAFRRLAARARLLGLPTWNEGR